VTPVNNCRIDRVVAVLMRNTRIRGWRRKAD
jgi:hypothetical protein